MIPYLTKAGPLIAGVFPFNKSFFSCIYTFIVKNYVMFIITGIPDKPDYNYDRENYRANTNIEHGISCKKTNNTGSEQGYKKYKACFIISPVNSDFFRNIYLFHDLRFIRVRDHRHLSG